MARPSEFDRTEVLDKAMELFWTQGYFNTSAQDIVEHMGLSRSSIYNTFTDKRTLFIEALKHYINKESKGLTHALNLLPPDKKSLQQILEMIVSNNFLPEKPKGCLVVNSAIEFANHDDEVKQIITENINQVVAAFERFIKAGQEQGNFNKSIPAQELAIMIFHQVTALRVTGKIITDRGFFKKHIETILQLFV
jgi:TetR/AcrR family transcriptional regulator, transcriptional repressor for nem operon